MARQPKVTFGREHQQRVKAGICHGFRGAGLAGGVFGGVKMQCHV
jgi:hypothetical protein